MVVSVVNLKARLAWLDNGATVPITTMTDVNGDETDDPEECLFAIVALPGGGWNCCDMRDFSYVKW